MKLPSALSHRQFGRLAAGVLASVILAMPASAQDTPAKPAAPPPPTAPPTAPPTPPADGGQAKQDLPKAGDLLDAALDAMGGRETFDKIESTFLAGTATSAMGEFTLEMASMKPNKFLLKQNFNGVSQEAGSDGETSWGHNSLGGYMLLPPQQVEIARKQANMIGAIMTIRDEVESLETVDHVKFGEVDCFKVKVITKQKAERFVYFSVESKLIEGFENNTTTPSGTFTVTTRFGEWKEVAPMKKVFTETTIQQGPVSTVLKLSKVEFNTLDATTFAVPKEVVELKEKAAAPPPPSAPSDGKTDPPAGDKPGPRPVPPGSTPPPPPPATPK